MTKQNSNKLSIFDRFNKNYPKILRFISEFSLVIFAMIKTLLTTIGLPVILVLLAIVEVERVKNGIEFNFGDNAANTYFSAWVLVLLNFIIEFSIIYVESTNGYSKQSFKSSIRLFKRNWGYRLGLGKEWKPEAVNPASSFLMAQRLVMLVIIVFALSGSLSEKMIEHSDTFWYVALYNIFFESNIATMMSWLSGLIFTVTAVYSARIIARYIAIQAMKAENDMISVARKITDKEQGIKKVKAIRYAEKRKALQSLTNLDQYDMVQVAPVMRFFDGVDKIWTRDYSSIGGLHNCIIKIDKNRGISDE